MKYLSFNRLNLSRQFLLMSLGIISGILVSVSIYLVNSSIDSKDSQLQVMANGHSSSVIEKIDRNFYERFGDVQAFAYNQLAIEMATKDSVSQTSQDFINTMVSYYVLYDLMMVCDLTGKVVAINTKNKSGHEINTNDLKSKNFVSSDWFQACVSGSGPEGGAWYSDFMENEHVSEIYNRKGWGMAFAAPIKKTNGQIVGVWYNFANWEDVTVGIRKETEEAIKKIQPNAFILLTNVDNSVIDSDDHTMILTSSTSLKLMEEGRSFNYFDRKIHSEDYLIGAKQGTGAYVYEGKDWSAVTFIPKTKFTLSYLYENLLVFLIVMCLVLLGVGYLFYRVASLVSTNINNLKLDIELLSKGELANVADTKMENEIGEMTSAIKVLVNRMGDTANFAKQIGEGNLSIQYEALSEKDVLGSALVTMRNNLKKIKEDENKRSWAVTGLAKFGEILRNQDQDVEKFGDQVLGFTIKYISANQGSLYVVNDDVKDDEYLEMISCYAWEKKKFVEQKIGLGEGLTGQCWQEGEAIYLTKVPDSYVKISSGLGEANPGNIFIVPLKANEVTYGVLEIASFKVFEDFERQFLMKLSENLAAAISTVRVNQKTKQLLTQTQQQAEEMRAQEEEMRQNMEELSATQEEMGRKENEYIRRIEDLEKKLNYKA